MKPSASSSIPLVLVSATATEDTCALSGVDGRKATALTKLSSSFSVASSCRKKSVRNAPKPAPRRPKKPKRRWKRRKPSAEKLPPKRKPKRKPKKKKSSQFRTSTWRGRLARAFIL